MKKSKMIEEMLDEYMLHKNTGMVVMTSFFEHLLERQIGLGMMPPAYTELEMAVPEAYSGVTTLNEWEKE